MNTHDKLLYHSMLHQILDKTRKILLFYEFIWKRLYCFYTWNSQFPLRDVLLWIRWVSLLLMYKLRQSLRTKKDEFFVKKNHHGNRNLIWGSQIQQNPLLNELITIAAWGKILRMFMVLPLQRLCTPWVLTI